MAKKLIVLDPGHGGKDSGAIGNGLLEKEINLVVAKKVGNKLNDYQNVEVKYTRETDAFVELSDRAEFANNLKADFFLSIHVNAGGGTGYEDFIYTGAGESTVMTQTMVHAEMRKFLDSLGIVDRGMKKANFAVLRETNMPAMLVENLFIDNLKDATLLKQGEFLDALAQAILNGLVRAFSLVKKETPQNDLATAVDVLVKKGVISSQQYWLANAVAGNQCNGEYVASLIIKVAAKLK